MLFEFISGPNQPNQRDLENDKREHRETSNDNGGGGFALESWAGPGRDPGDSKGDVARGALDAGPG